MKKSFLALLMLLITSGGFSQNTDIDQIISQGIKYHDEGKYELAIEKYKSALKINKKSTLAHYEIAYTYFVLQQYDNAIKHSNIVIKQKTDHLEPAFIVLGNSYDLSGNAKQAIKTYEKGLKKFPESYLLNYNLAFTCYLQKSYDKAEQAAIRAIEIKPNHGSSHLVLSGIMQEKGQRIKSVMALYYFLYLEPNSKRSVSAYENLKRQLQAGVKKKDDKNINVSLNLGSMNDPFSSVDLMLSLKASTRYTDENKNKTEIEHFIDMNNSLFGILSESKNNNKGFWWDFYVSKFSNILKNGHVETLSYYISQPENNDVINNWLKDNSSKVENMKTKI